MLSFRRFLGVFTSILCGLAALSSARPACVAQQFTFKTTTAGLGNLDVNCLAQDATGYLWVGTENGLYRYDGQAFRQFGAADGLHAHVIQSLFAGPDKTLFVGTTTGVYFERLDGHFAAIHAPAPVTTFSQRIGSVLTALAPDRIVTADRSGAFLLHRTAADNWVAEPMRLEGQTIWSVLAGPDGALWYGCDADLCRLKNGQTTHLGQSLKLPDDHWLHLHLARDGHLWIRGATHLGEVIPSEDRFEEHDPPGRSNSVPYDELTEDKQGRIVASQGATFALWESGAWHSVTAQNGLSRFDISDLFVDREGSLWIGVVGHGLARWVGQDQWEAYTAANGLSDDIVWASLRDQLGQLWIGTESGLDILLPGQHQPKPWQAPGIKTSRAVSLTQDSEGAIWMGSAAGNLVRIDPHTRAARQWTVPEVFRALADGHHGVWIATGDGLFYADAAAQDHAPHLVQSPAFAHPNQRFTDLSLDPSGQLWATGDGGLYRFDNSAWHRVDPGLAGVSPTLIAADQNGFIWASGAFPGLVRLRVVADRVVESASIVRPHLLSDQVVSLAIDHRGWLWVGQDAGISRFDRRRWRSYTKSDGLIWNDTDTDALSEDRDGTLWIGTSGGLAHFMRPQGPAPQPLQPPVFSQTAFASESIANDAEVPWSESPLIIDIATLNFRDASHIRLRYRLLGVESDWVETSARSVRYARLEPGPYRFQAVAVDENAGVVSPTPGESSSLAISPVAVSPVQEISFVITPRWWQSRPLRLFLVLLMAMTVVLAWRSSVHLLVRQKRLLEHAVHQRTADLEREKSELLRAREQMRHFAEHDDLTGLWNHRIIMERLRQEVDRSRREQSPISVILVDLDHFKNVNDTCGHPAGDLVLKEIGSIFERAVRSYDWVGRYGGEEFLLILPGSGFAGARVRAEQLRMAVQWAHIHDGQRAIPVTASFGVASGFPSGYESLIQAADAALYRAKDNGRNCVMATEIEPPERSESTQKRID